MAYVQDTIPEGWEPPAPGEDQRLDAVIAATWAALLEKGNPENITPEQNRRVVAYAMLHYEGTV